MGLMRALRGLVSDSSGSRARPEPVPTAWVQLKAFLHACEAHHLGLAGLRPEDAIGFWAKRTTVRDACAAGLPKERAATESGFVSWEHWTTVERYFEARYSELVVAADGSFEIRLVEEFRQASVLASQALDRIALAAAEARTLEPIEGVSLDRFATIAAAMTTLGPAPSRSEVSMVLGELGVGPAAYGAARRGWLVRIKEDTTGRLKTRYRQAFSAARDSYVEATEPPEESGVRAIGASALARRSWIESDVG